MSDPLVELEGVERWVREFHAPMADKIRAARAALAEERRARETQVSSINEALNMGDGSYKP